MSNLFDSAYDCVPCHGTGEQRNGEPCPNCQGQGYFDPPPCPECGHNNDCPHCAGIVPNEDSSYSAKLGPL